MLKKETKKRYFKCITINKKLQKGITTIRLYLYKDK